MSSKKKSSNNRLLIDCRLINGSGISTYIINLLRQYQQIDHGLKIELLVNTFDALLPHKQIALSYPQHLFHESVYSIGEQLNTPKIIKQTGVL
ncbi:hypothetical protein KKA14_06865, partial [bacterium]|nr:hypothetical protein [bacterium]